MVDLVVMGGAAAARNGLTDLPVNGNEDFYKINATNFLVAEEDLYIVGVTVQTAAIANVAQSRFKRADENDWMDLRNFARDQTGAYVPQTFIPMCVKFPKGKQLEAEINNGNNSQVDQMGIFLARSPDEYISFGGLQDIGKYVREGYELVAFTGATTVTAALWSEVTLTPVTWVPDDNAIYHIAALGGWGATGMWGRVKHRKSGTQGIRPGFYVGDDASPPVFMLTFQDFGKFVGSSYPVIQHISVAADTAQEYLALIKKVG